MVDARYETLGEVEERLAANAEYGKSGYPAWYRRPVPVGWFLAVAAALLFGLLLLAGFVFHEVGITTPLDGLYTWLHTTFGGMEEPAVAVDAYKYIW